MSVVNDVLKNLENRQIKKNMAGNNALMGQQSSQVKYLFWGMLCLSLSLVISISVLAYVWTHTTGLQQTSALPYELLLAQESDLSAAKSDEQSSSINPSLKDPAAQRDSIDKTVVPQSESVVNIKDSKKLPSKASVVKKTQSTQASETAINAINKGDTEKAKQSLAKSTTDVQEQVKLRLMLKDNPQDVLGYIQKNYHYQDNPVLIAMAAQGQQRSGQHKSAVVLYRKLIRIQPNNAKWRSGIGISYEILGMVKKAKTSYKLALSLPNLPMPLRTFSENRLQSLI